MKEENGEVGILIIEQEKNLFKNLDTKKRYYLCIEVLKCLSLALSPSFVLVLVNHYQVHNEKCTQ